MDDDEYFWDWLHSKEVGPMHMSDALDVACNRLRTELDSDKNLLEHLKCADTGDMYKMWVDNPERLLQELKTFYGQEDTEQLKQLPNVKKLQAWLSLVFNDEWRDDPNANDHYSVMRYNCWLAEEKELVEETMKECGFGVRIPEDTREALSTFTNVMEGLLEKMTEGEYKALYDAGMKLYRATS